MLVMPLVKARKGLVGYRKCLVAGVIKGEIEGIVENSLVLVWVVELEIEVDGGVVLGIRGFVEGRNVKVLDGANWVCCTETEPHKESCEA